MAFSTQHHYHPSSVLPPCSTGTVKQRELHFPDSLAARVTDPIQLVDALAWDLEGESEASVPYSWWQIKCRATIKPLWGFWVTPLRSLCWTIILCPIYHLSEFPQLYFISQLCNRGIGVLRIKWADGKWGVLTIRLAQCRNWSIFFFIHLLLFVKPWHMGYRTCLNMYL